ncbi:hypothetical protein B0O80DRAFT_502172 [Mortierella sp. GBAus27b]|nr:hypothetical protein B0O80DRAFT_502172 [Mortierella sp. GBAus27b]
MPLMGNEAMSGLPNGAICRHRQPVDTFNKHQKADGAFDGGGAVVATMPPPTPGHPLSPSPTLETDKSSSSSYHHGGASRISHGCQAILKVGIVFANPGESFVSDSGISNIQQPALHGVLQQYRQSGGIDN